MPWALGILAIQVLIVPVLAVVSCILITYKTPRSDEGGIWEKVHADWVSAPLENFTPPTDV